MDELFDWEPTLRELSLNRLIKSYWEQPAIVTKILYFFTHEYTESMSWVPINQKLLSWTREILDQIHSRTPDIPFAIRELLVTTIKPIGERLINFLAQVALHLIEKQIPSAYPSLKNYFDNIYWTNYGTIDEVKIFKAIYTCKPENIEMDMVYMYQQARKNYMEDFVDSIWNELSEKNQKHIYPQYSCSTRLLVEFYVESRRREMIDDDGREYNYWVWYHYHRKSIAKCSSQIISNTMKNEIRKANYIGVKYMFSFLEKNGYVNNTEFIEKAANIQGKRFSSLEDLFQIKSIDIIMLLRKKIIQPRFLIDCEILSIISLSWPWKYEFIDVLKSTQSYCGTARDVIKIIAPKIVEEMALYRIIEHTSCWKIKEIFKIIPDDNSEKSITKLFKSSIDTSCRKNTDMLEALYLVLQSCNDDECIFDNWEQQAVQLYLENFYNHLLIREKYEIVEFFMKKSMPYEELRLDFKQQFDIPAIYQYFLYHKKYDAAEKFLDWQFEAEYEKNYYKRIYNCENSTNFFD